MKKFFRFIHRTIILILKSIYWLLVLVLLAVIAGVVYLLYPLYNPPPLRIPISQDSDDFIRWTLHLEPKNPAIFQQLTVYRDGRSEGLIARPFGDYDTPELPAWKLGRNRDNGSLEFRKEEILTELLADRFFRAGVNSGVADIRDESYHEGQQLTIEIKIGHETLTATGPAFLGSPIAYPPEKWLNRICWQKLGQIIAQNPKVREILSRKHYVKPGQQITSP